MLGAAALITGLLATASARADHTGCGGYYQGYVAIEVDGAPVSFCSDGTFDGINDTAGMEVVPRAGDGDEDIAHGCAEGQPVQAEIDLDVVQDGTSWCAPLPTVE